MLVLGVLLNLGMTSASSADMISQNGVDANDPEAVIRLLVEANARKDLDTMKRFMGQEPTAIGYTIGGRKFVGWKEFAQVMEEEFRSVQALEIPITDLRVWRNGDVAWFAMELDYIREVGTLNHRSKTTIPLRETGVLERRRGRWILVNWHESLQAAGSAPSIVRTGASVSPKIEAKPPDVGGEWEIKEEDKSYIATLDARGNGTYNWQGGTIITTQISGRLWEGTWSQTGNDREGGFEVLLSEDHTKAEGVWWYTRVGDRKNIPPRITGGSYVFTRLTSAQAGSQGPVRHK